MDKMAHLSDTRTRHNEIKIVGTLAPGGAGRKRMLSYHSEPNYEGPLGPVYGPPNRISVVVPEDVDLDQLDTTLESVPSSVEVVGELVVQRAYEDDALLSVRIDARKIKVQTSRLRVPS